jgi:hypothetical protein
VNGLKKLDLNLLGGELAEKRINDRLIAVLVASGHSSEQIAARLELPEKEVEQVVLSPRTTQMVFKLQSAMGLKPDEMLERAAPLAVQKKVWLMLHSEDEKVQNAAATDVLDRALGRAVQKIETRNISVQLESLPQVEDHLSRLQTRLVQLETERLKLEASQTDGRSVQVKPEEAQAAWPNNGADSRQREAAAAKLGRLVEEPAGAWLDESLRAAKSA